MKYIAFVSDIHVGSIFGLCPPNFDTSAGNVVALNKGQKYLWGRWLELCATARKLEPYLIVVNGDVIDGRQEAQRGTELCLPTIADQKEAAKKVLAPLLKHSQEAPLWIQGTEYHDLKAGEAVDDIAAHFTAKRGQHPSTGFYSYDYLDFEVEGVVINVSHGISVGAGFYRATPLDREGIWSALAGKEKMMPKADLVVRSHGHTFVHLEHASKHIVMTPCWQLQTRHMRKNSVYRMVPDIGAIWATIDGREKTKGRDPVQVHKLLFPLPPMTAKRL